MDTREAGALGGKARAENLSQQRIDQIARKGNKQRWKNYYEQHPEKKKAKTAAKVARKRNVGVLAREKATTKKQLYLAARERWRRVRAVNPPKGAA